MLEQDPETGKVTHSGNVTMGDAMAVEPRILYARCVDAANKPAGFRGEWPMLGEVYPVRVIPHAETGELMVAVLGFYGFYPYFNFFAAHRFKHVATMWPN